MSGLQIGRQARRLGAGVGAAERLPGEIIVGDGKVAGEPLDAALQHLRHAVRPVGGERAKLRRGNAEAEERRGAAREPAHEALVEQRRDVALEDHALLVERAGGEQGVEPRAVEPRHRVAGADEAPEQAVAVEASRESLDAPSPVEAAPVPIGARRFVEAGAQLRLIDGEILAPVGAAEEVEEGGVIAAAPRGRAA